MFLVEQLHFVYEQLYLMKGFVQVLGTVELALYIPGSPWVWQILAVQATFSVALVMAGVAL